jgi:hypothetical protein
MPTKTAKRPVGLSTSETKLYDHLQHHVQAESGMMDLYDSLAATGHPYISFLAELIGEDEARHHRLFEKWMTSIRDMASFTPSGDGLPDLDHARVTMETVSLVDRLIEFEKADLAAAKALRKEIEDMLDTTVWGALIEMITADTQKHLGILKFIRKQLKAR